MHEAMETTDELTGRLCGTLMHLFKGGNHGAMTAIGEYDLSLSQLRALFVLENSDHELAVNEIADRVGLSMAAMGRAIDAMHKSGLVLRREDEADRRIKRITLTEKGATAIERIGQARMAGIRTFVAKLSAQEREQLAAAVETLDALTAIHLPRPGCAPAASATPTTETEQLA
jgi:DNA-binding MarR family transcriptional regulator